MPASISIFRAAVLAGACLCATAVRAADAFEQACQGLAARAQVRVVFEDAVVTRDNARSVDELKALSRQPSAPYHQVFGLTHAQAAARYAVRASTLASPDGRVCAVPSLEVTLSVAGLTVYLARELAGNSCRRAIVDEHEQEHVAVWRNHLRAGARLLEPVLREHLSEPMVFASPQALQQAFRPRVEAVLNPLLRQLQDGIVAANRQIDSPQSYQATSQRLQACP